jgi:hypothetical protein
MMREDLSTSERRIDAFAGKWIEKISCITYERRALRPCTPGGRCKRPGCCDGIDALGVRESGCDSRPLGDPALEKFSAVDRHLSGARHGNHHGDVGQSIANIRYSAVSTAIHVHLAEIIDSLHAAVMGDECDAAWPACRADQAEPSPDHRSETISANHHRCGATPRLSVRIDRCDAAYSTIGLTNDVGDSHAFFDCRAACARFLDENRIENGPANCEAAIPVSAKPVIGGKLTVDRCAVRRVHPHPRELRGSARFDLIERAHFCENPRRLGTQVFGASLVARKSGAIENRYVDPFTREKKCSR